MGATVWRYELSKGKLYCALLGDRVHRGVSPAERQPESSRAARRSTPYKGAGSKPKFTLL